MQFHFLQVKGRTCRLFSQEQILFCLDIPVPGQPDAQREHTGDDSILAVEVALGKFSHEGHIANIAMTGYLKEQQAKEIINKDQDAKKRKIAKESSDVFFFRVDE